MGGWPLSSGFGWSVMGGWPLSYPRDFQRRHQNSGLNRPWFYERPITMKGQTGLPMIGNTGGLCWPGRTLTGRQSSVQ